MTYRPAALAAAALLALPAVLAAQPAPADDPFDPAFDPYAPPYNPVPARPEPYDPAGPRDFDPRYEDYDRDYGYPEGRGPRRGEPTFRRRDRSDDGRYRPDAYAETPGRGRELVYDRPHLVLRGGASYGIVAFSDEYEFEDDLLDSALDGGDGLVGIEGAVGYEFPTETGDGDWVNSLRVEAAYRYLQPTDDEDVFGETAFHDGLVTFGAHFRNGPVRPFLGAGVGVSFLGQGEDLDDQFDDAAGLAAQGFVGIGFELTPNLDLEFKADYTARFLDVENDFGEEFDADLDTFTGTASLVLRL